MNLLRSNKQVGILTVLSGLIAFACIVLSAVAVNFHFEVFNDPSLMLTLAGVSAMAGKWSMICDMVGYYLLLLPVIYYLHDWMREKTAWSNLLTFSGLAYVLIGSIGAAILAVIWPNTLNAYPTASPEAQQLLKSNFEFVNAMVYNSLWNLLEMIFAGTWWLAIGILLYKAAHKGIAYISIITGLFSLLDAVSGMIENAALHELSLNIYLYASVIWTIWMGIVIYRKPL